MQKDHLGVEMSERISMAYLKYCRSKCRLRNLSDGSNAEMSGGHRSEDPRMEGLVEEALMLAGL